MDVTPVDADIVSAAKIIIAGMCGGMVRLIFKPAESIIKSITLVMGSASCGYYGTPIAMMFLPDSWEFLSDGIAALIGLLGLSIAGGVLKAVDKIDFHAWVSRKFGNGQS